MKTDTKEGAEETHIRIMLAALRGTREWRSSQVTHEPMMALGLIECVEVPGPGIWQRGKLCETTRSVVRVTARGLAILAASGFDQ
jgi:hypothetical protein